MFLRRCFLTRTQFYRKYLQNDIASYTIRRNFQQISNFNGISPLHSRHRLHQNENALINKHSFYLFILNRRWFSKGLLDGDLSNLKTSLQEKELKKIKELFPLSRVTLNELASKTPDKIFEIHYKQNTVAPKVAKKKIIQGDWTCTYAFIWPEKMKFESTAVSKRQAAEKAATNALHWLYIKKRIDDKGSPIYNKVVLDELKCTLNEPIMINISEKSVDRIDRIWNEYESGIKDIYEETIREAMKKTTQPLVSLTRDSTIDEEDKFPEEENEMDDEVSDISEIKAHIHPVYGKSITQPSMSTLDRRDRVLKQKFEQYDEGLLPLPIDDYVEQITSTLEDSRVVVVVGAAGCGKSTRAPAAILRKCGARTAAIVSEPRRVAAIGLAERVASELGEEVGESVGYQIRLHARQPRPPGGSILYCTSGVLLRRMQLNPGLEGCTHVIIDEAHERDVNTDITLLLLKRALVMNPKLKVMIMSATLDTEVFTRYFESCPIVEVPGRVFPVEVSYLEDIQNKFNIKLPNTMENCNKEDSKPHINCLEVAEVIKAVDKMEPEGAILVFLPGWAEIKLTKQLLDESFGESSMHLVLPVHSRLSTNDQTKMFSKPMLGVRKIVLATNIAETSITIPDVVYVIDTGAHKENRIKEQTGTASLETVWVSQAGAKQRTGRAGRVQPGHCYRLYTKEKEAEFAAHTTPEILRIPLVQTVLDCKSYAPDDKIENFLAQLPEPPSKKAIQFAVKDLVDLGALSPTERLTRLGELLSTMTLHPRVGCGVLHAAVVGDVLAAANVATQCSDNVELFQNPADRKDEMREIKSKYSRTSDHTALHWIQDEYEQILNTSGWQGVDEWCDRLGLKKDRLKYVKSLSNLYLEQLLKSGIVEPVPDVEDLNRFSDIDEMTTAVLLSGTNSLLTTKKHVKTKGKLKTVTNLYTSTGDRAHISTESVNYATARTSKKNNLLAYFGGYHSTERRALVVYKTSLITPHAALLFCKGNVYKKVVSDNNVETTIISLPKHKLDIHLPASQADHILKVREMLWNTFQYYIERDTKNLDYDVHTTISRFKIRLMKTIGRILVEADKEYIQGKNYFDDETETE